jgi:GNAT superfamily N-acetyltransferase
MPIDGSFLRRMTDIREITAREAHPLRGAVLRPGLPAASLDFPEDAHPDAFHLGVYDGDDLVAVGSFSPAPTPFRAGAVAWQLRGMAVADGYRSGGLGAALLAAAIERCRAGGASVLWCNARDSAARFYERLGFVQHGDSFITKTTQLPHHVMVLDL